MFNTRPPGRLNDSTGGGTTHGKNGLKENERAKLAGNDILLNPALPFQMT